MSNFKKRWNKMNTLERVMSAVTMCCSVVIVVLGVLYLLDLAAFGITAAMPLMGVASLAQCVLYWRRDRVISVMMAMVGLFIIGVSVYMALGK